MGLLHIYLYLLLYEHTGSKSAAKLTPHFLKLSVDVTLLNNVFKPCAASTDTDESPSCGSTIWYKMIRRFSVLNIICSVQSVPLKYQGLVPGPCHTYSNHDTTFKCCSKHVVVFGKIISSILHVILSIGAAGYSSFHSAPVVKH